MAGPVNPKQGFTYTTPTQNTDGSPLVASNIAKYQIGLGTTPGNYTVTKDDIALESGATQTTPLSLIGTLAFGQWYAAVRTVSKDGQTSAWSAEIPFMLEAAKPNAPSNFSIA